MENKLTASLDIQSLYTNITVKEYIQQLKFHTEKNKSSLLFLVPKIIKIIKFCTSHCFFKHNGICYQQKFGLCIGSPLSEILACLFSRILKPNDFKIFCQIISTTLDTLTIF